MHQGMLASAFMIHFRVHLGFPDSSVGKESACNAGDPGAIPGPAGPRQSLLLAKDPTSFCENLIYPKCIRFPETSLNKGKRKIQSVNP